MQEPTIQSIRQEFLSDLKQAFTSQDTEALRVKYLGRKGPMQALMKNLGALPAGERPLFGKSVNELKEEVEQAINKRLEEFIIDEENARLGQETVDITLPGRRRFLGNKHVLTRELDRMIDILTGMGFTVAYGPDVESDYYNFEALNFPDDHPARDMQDTFYISEKVLLRTHTSNIQGRVMEAHKPPLRVICPGKVYRNEAITARSHVFFHQVDAFYIDKNVTFADLMGTLQEFIYKLFEKEVEIRYRPSFFPFVEPGMEVDIRCMNCNGAGCQLCKQSGWLEVLGAGMIHPEVLKSGDIDPEVYSGYAWGMGVERLLMLKHRIQDIRNFTENDMRFLSQFAGV